PQATTCASAVSARPKLAPAAIFTTPERPAGTEASQEGSSPWAATVPLRFRISRQRKDAAMALACRARTTGGMVPISITSPLARRTYGTAISTASSREYGISSCVLPTSPPQATTRVLAAANAAEEHSSRQTANTPHHARRRARPGPARPAGAVIVDVASVDMASPPLRWSLARGRQSLRWMLSIRLPDRFDYAKRCLKLRRNPEAPDTVMTMEFLNPLEHWSQCEVAAWKSEAFT